MAYEYLTEPFDHQRERFELYREKAMWGHLWGCRTGKSKVSIDTAAYAYEAGEIDAVFIVAPGSVHLNWVINEIPVHCPPRVNPHAFAWQTKKAKTQVHTAAAQKLLHHPGLAFLTMSYDGLTTKAGAEYVAQFLKKRKVLYVVDEAHRIKSPPRTCLRTKYVLRSGIHAPMRRILTGTPVTNSPFDVFHPVHFLDDEFWKRVGGFGSFTSFKTFYGIWRDGYNGGRRFKQCTGYRRVKAHLQPRLATITDRVLTEEVLDMPPEVFEKRYFEMTPPQAKLYKQLKDHARAVLADGLVVEVESPMVLLLRLQQVSCGYVPTDDDQPTHMIEGPNPRLQTLLDIVEDLCGGSAVIWARFHLDIDLIAKALIKKKYTFVTYDGRTGDEDRMDAVKRFQDKGVQLFVANPAAAGEGLPLYAADTMIYYSNGFKLVDRLQSQDRGKVMGKDVRMGVVDIIGHGTVDTHIVTSLRQKLNLASQVTGDALKEWL